MSNHRLVLGPMPQPPVFLDHGSRNFSPGEQRNVSTTYTAPKPSDPDMPPEILQTIFRKLGLYDLVRCRQVCKTWANALPGNDPVLHCRLFTSSKRVVTATNNYVPTIQFQLRFDGFS
ncbi:hypothetical protein CC86DRAFT_461861 [Ophiobolus disseminans]|uniref:F-box domain-containing protein n=1 Tax=Ophiobolus disseminans TaxID=1469910 RepID=A0A6A7AJW9_9PLEO|nr:hypothetical protein CC86DRAFT_461861 [Ophiobolus disseminans]